MPAAAALGTATARLGGEHDAILDGLSLGRVRLSPGTRNHRDAVGVGAKRAELPCPFLLQLKKKKQIECCYYLAYGLIEAHASRVCSVVSDSVASWM